MIDPTNQYDQIVLNRISNLEERVKDLMIAHQRFITLTQVQQIYSVLVTELERVKSTVSSLERRVAILEDLPPIE
jgi:hypothetical protein